MVRTGLRFAAALLIIGAASASAATPAAQLHNAFLINAQDARLNLNRVPVTDSNGVVKYFDIALGFNVAANGTLSINPSLTKFTPSPNLITGAFKPGRYSNTIAGQWCVYHLGSPAPVGGSRTAGSLTSEGSSDCALAIDWVTGPVQGHPDQARLQQAGITTNAYSWGTLGTVGDDFTYLGWRSGHLVGVVQTGNSFVVRNYGTDNRVDLTANFTFCPSCD
jgi:hypothetical protein